MIKEDTCKVSYRNKKNMKYERKRGSTKLIFSGTLKGLKGPLHKQHMTDNERREQNNFNFGTRLLCVFFLLQQKKY